MSYPGTQSAAQAPAAAAEQAAGTAQAVALNELARFQNDPALSAKVAQGDVATLAAYRKWQAAALGEAPLPYTPRPTAASAPSPAPVLEPGTAGDSQPADPLEAAALAALSAPSTPADYRINYEGQYVEPQHDQQLRSVLHGLHVPQAMVGEMTQAWLRATGEQKIDIDAQRQTNLSKLVTDVGGREKAIEIAKKAEALIDALPAEQKAIVDDVLDQTALGTDPWLLRRLAAIADIKTARGK